MSEIRYNALDSKYVIISEERSARPFSTNSAKKKSEDDYSAERCPFCEGNEKDTPPELYALREDISMPDQEGWKVRVVPNKYSVLDPESVETEGETGLFRVFPGTGSHEVLIETPVHETSLANLSEQQICYVLKTYRLRLRELTSNMDKGYVSVFKNHGADAGASLPHTHSQLIATHFIPGNIEKRVRTLAGYYGANKRCLLCDVVEQELKEEERVVYSSDNFVCLVPYWAGMPLEVSIIPRKHNDQFLNADDRVLTDLAGTLKLYLRSLKAAAGDVSYNLVFSLLPVNKVQNEEDKKLISNSFHWYVMLLPRTTKFAGFEISTGVNINTASPEYAASILKKEIKSII